MPDPLQHAFRKASGLTRQTALYAGNAFDRVFRAASLVQAGQTPFETLYTDGLVSLRYYPPLAEDFIELDGVMIDVERKPHKTPIVIVPPLAVNMLIYDLFPQRSLVRFLRAKGFEVYLIDWGVPTRQHSHYNLHTVSNGMDSSSPNRHLRAKMVSEQSTIVKMRRSPSHCLQTN